MNLAYQEGKARAEEDFGLRTAGDSFHKGLPRNDEHTGAGRLAKTLSDLDSERPVPKEERKGRLDRLTRWGAAGSPYGTGSSSFDYSGIGNDGAAI